MKNERRPGIYANLSARNITKQNSACGDTGACYSYIYLFRSEHGPMHLICDERATRVVNYLNGFCNCD
jgi:hypothetical protein